jgi:hypothetical protein
LKFAKGRLLRAAGIYGRCAEGIDKLIQRAKVPANWFPGLEVLLINRYILL